jgi:hypothetical protein
MTATALYQTSTAAWAKYHRNAAKLAWMDATRQNGAAIVGYGQQLEGYRMEAEKATEAFTAACAGMTAHEVVAVIMAAKA